MAHQEINIPVPSALGPAGSRLWREMTSTFGDWLPNDLVLLEAACGCRDQLDRLADEISVETDPKILRKLRSDARAEKAALRQLFREMGLAAKVPDSRPPRIGGRY